MYTLGKCQWTISKSVTGKQTIRTLVRNATNPYLKIENNALQTVCAEMPLHNSIENMILKGT